MSSTEAVGGTAIPDDAKLDGLLPGDSESEDQIRDRFKFLPQLKLCLDLLSRFGESPTPGPVDYIGGSSSSGRPIHDTTLELSSQIRSLLRKIEQAHACVAKTPKIDLSEDDLLSLAQEARKATDTKEKLERRISQLESFKGTVHAHARGG